MVKGLMIEGVKAMLSGNTPNFLVIGAQKAGTTSLHYYLGQHPMLVPSRPKETYFFDVDDHFEKGRGWYETHFKKMSLNRSGFKYFESNPNYLYVDHAVGRIYKLYPQMKFIVLLRDPVKRAFSAWNMYREFKESNRPLPAKLFNPYKKGTVSGLVELYEFESFPTFGWCIEQERKRMGVRDDMLEPSFLRRGLYINQLKRYHDLFGKDRLKIFGFNDLVQNKKVVLNEILDFVGLKPTNWPDLNEAKKHSIEYPHSLTDEISNWLTDFYKPHNEQLFDYLGYELRW